MSDTSPGEFGSRALPAERDALRDTWHSVGPLAERLNAGVALCTLGDFGPRDELFAAMVSGDVSDDLRIPLQRVVLSIATAEHAGSDELAAYEERVADWEQVQLAGSGLELLARDAIPLYLGIAIRFDEVRLDAFVMALESGFDLTGVRFDEFDEDASVAEWGSEMRAKAHSVDARYILRGEPFHPGVIMDELTDHIARSSQTSRSTGLALFDQLAIWSGVPRPVLPQAQPSATDVATATEYVSALAELPWRPGVKYFYGHDVDGGTGLHASIPTGASRSDE